jgi:hypothetical protein
VWTLDIDFETFTFGIIAVPTDFSVFCFRSTIIFQ